jgi:hypothetical protein
MSFVTGVIPFHWTQIVNIKRGPSPKPDKTPHVLTNSRDATFLTASSSDMGKKNGFRPCHPPTHFLIRTTASTPQGM